MQIVQVEFVSATKGIHLEDGVSVASSISSQDVESTTDDGHRFLVVKVGDVFSVPIGTSVSIHHHDSRVSTIRTLSTKINATSVLFTTDSTTRDVRALASESSAFIGVVGRRNCVSETEEVDVRRISVGADIEVGSISKESARTSGRKVGVGTKASHGSEIDFDDETDVGVVEGHFDTEPDFVVFGIDGTTNSFVLVEDSEIEEGVVSSD